MEKKELKKLRREELLELLLEQTRRADALEKQVRELKTELNDRRIQIDNSGSIAEAALAVNNVFLAAQQAADQYLNNIREQVETQPAARRRRRRMQGEEMPR